MNNSTKDTIELLKRLSQATGVTGYTQENNIHQVITEELTPYVDRVERDRIGSVIGYKVGQQTTEPRRKIMLAAHLDEIGAIVTQIDGGFLRFTQIGGLDDRVLMGQEVTVHAKQNVPGIIGAIPPHLQTGTSDRVNHKEMLIDIGLPANEVKQMVQVGDLISFARPPAELLNGLLSAKAMDNRSSVATMIVCLQQLNQMQHQWDVYAVATADEEWGNYTGATTQAYAIQPDVAIVNDVTFADVSENDVKINAGPVISLGPSNHPVIRQRLVDICDELELKYQTDVMTSGGGTDAFAIEVSREGVPTILLSIPSRYMHTPVEVVHPKDVIRAGRLMAYFIAGLDETFVETLIPKC